MTQPSSILPNTRNEIVIVSAGTDTDKVQDSFKSAGSDPLMQDLLRNMRVQSTDDARRRELGHRLV